MISSIQFGPLASAPGHRLVAEGPIVPLMQGKMASLIPLAMMALKAQGNLRTTSLDYLDNEEMMVVAGVEDRDE